MENGGGSFMSKNSGQFVISLGNNFSVCFTLWQKLFSKPFSFLKYNLDSDVEP